MRKAVCPDCSREVGVQPEYNHSIGETGARRDMWRLSVHRAANGTDRCLASRSFISELAIWETEKPA